MHLRFASLVVICGIAVAPIACSSGDTNNTTGADTGTGEDTFVEEDTGGGEDTGSGEDSSVVDSTVADSGTSETSEGGADTAPADVSVTCTTPGATEARDCGKCGTQARLCNSDKTWLPWGLCTGETGACVPGETRMVTCGKCGKRTETCNTTCAWDPSACTGEGLCNAGDMEIQYGACSNPTYVKTRTCSSTTCAWGDWSGCVPPKGWVDMASTSITGRYYHTAVWSGTEMIVWGGYSSSGSYLADGAAYDPTSNSWSPIASSPLAARQQHNAEFADGKMIVYGGYSGTYYGDAAAYDPAANSWSPLSPPSSDLDARYYSMSAVDPTKKLVAFWGGYGNTYVMSSYNKGTGGIFDVSAGTWKSIAQPTDTVMPYPRRYLATTWWAPDGFYVWGGYGVYGTTSSSNSYTANGAVFDPSTSTWRAMTDTNAPPGRQYATAVWTGAEAIVWGGYSGTYRNDGKIYRP